MGIAESGHITYNDLRITNINEKDVIRVIELNGIFRRSQVNVDTLADLKLGLRYSFVLTVSTLFSGNHFFVSVPRIRKEGAVQRILKDEVDQKCLIYILRTHQGPNLLLTRSQDH